MKLFFHLFSASVILPTVVVAQAPTGNAANYSAPLPQARAPTAAVVPPPRKAVPLQQGKVQNKVTGNCLRLPDDNSLLLGVAPCDDSDQRQKLHADGTKLRFDEGSTCLAALVTVGVPNLVHADCNKATSDSTQFFSDSSSHLLNMAYPNKCAVESTTGVLQMGDCNDANVLIMGPIVTSAPTAAPTHKAPPLPQPTTSTAQLVPPKKTPSPTEAPSGSPVKVPTYSTPLPKTGAPTTTAIVPPKITVAPTDAPVAMVTPPPVAPVAPLKPQTIGPNVIPPKLKTQIPKLVATPAPTDAPTASPVKVPTYSTPLPKTGAPTTTVVVPLRTTDAPTDAPTDSPVAMVTPPPVRNSFRMGAQGVLRNMGTGNCVSYGGLNSPGGKLAPSWKHCDITEQDQTVLFDGSKLHVSNAYSSFSKCLSGPMDSHPWLVLAPCDDSNGKFDFFLDAANRLQNGAFPGKCVVEAGTPTSNDMQTMSHLEMGSCTSKDVYVLMELVTKAPTTPPTMTPTGLPTATPTGLPSAAPVAMKVPPLVLTHAPSDSPVAMVTPPPVAPVVPQTSGPNAIPPKLQTQVPKLLTTPAPTDAPTAWPTASPTEIPTYSPTHAPTDSPVVMKTPPPVAPVALLVPQTSGPNAIPPKLKTLIPKLMTTPAPTHAPTASPTFDPALKATAVPSMPPTLSPSAFPSEAPSQAAITPAPTNAATLQPTKAQTQAPTASTPATMPGTAPTAPTAPTTQTATSSGLGNTNMGISPMGSLKGTATGDPHFKTWTGEKYDFHGGCDLLFLKNDDFDEGRGMEIQIRTSIVDWWSFIESAVVRIGEETLEVRGGKNGAYSYWLNGKQGKPLKNKEKLILSGHKVMYLEETAVKRKFRFDLKHSEAVGLEIIHDFISVTAGSKANSKGHAFEGSLGLMGKYPGGEWMARDGKTIMTDPDEFGKEWQVLLSESMLFHTLGDGVHHPTACAMPNADMNLATHRRRLGEAAIDEEAAEAACEHASEDDFDSCVYDVLTTNDAALAGAY